MVKKVVFAVGLIVWFINGFGQIEDPCTVSLNKATEEFEHGHFYQIKSLLDDCIRRGFSREQETQAHYLLTRTYLFLDKPDSAEYHYLKFLKLNPLFKVDEENDPIDIVYLSEKFTTTPIFTFSAGTGLNISRPYVIQEGYTAYSSQPKYKSGIGFHIPVGIEMHLGDYLTVGTKPGFALKRWRYANEIFLDENYDDFDQLYISGDTTSIIERNVTVDIPVFVKYTFDIEPYKPFVYGGYSLNLLFFSRQNFYYLDRNGPTQTPNEGPEVNNIKTREFMDHSLMFGGGILYQMGNNYLGVDLQLNVGTRMLNNENNRYEVINNHYNSKSNFNYGYVDNSFRLNTLRLNVSFIKPLYRPRKREENTIRDLIKNIKSEE